MKKKEAEEKIRELAAEGKITYAPQDLVKEYEAEIEELLTRVFGLKRWIVTDWSTALDFGQPNWRRKCEQMYGLSGLERNAKIVDIAKGIRMSRAH